MLDLNQEQALPDELASLKDHSLTQSFESIYEEVRQGDFISLEEYIQTRNLTTQPILSNVPSHSSETYSTSTR